MTIHNYKFSRIQSVEATKSGLIVKGLSNMHEVIDLNLVIADLPKLKNKFNQSIQCNLSNIEY